jgi:hypothetical protein
MVARRGLRPAQRPLNQYADAVERLPYAVLSERLALWGV